MYDKALVLEILRNIKETLQNLIEGTQHLNSINELMTSATGMLLLDGICMNLIVIGEEVKNLDKHSHQLLLPSYSTIAWRKITGMRDFIAHHYFDVDADKVFETLRNDIPPLLETILQMEKDLSGQA